MTYPLDSSSADLTFTTSAIGNADLTFGSASLSTGITVKRWDGATWVSTTLRQWNGTSWIHPVLKRWDGATWVSF